MDPEQRDAASARLDEWLRSGCVVLTASERAARALTLNYHRRRRNEGISAWPAPLIQDWQRFVQAEWEARRRDARLVLNALQERAVWAGILERSTESRILLEEPRQRMAVLAASAHSLVCAYAPQYLAVKSRAAWQQDAGAFSGWLREFDSVCRAEDVVTQARLPLELAALLEDEAGKRPPLLLVGFDRILPVQRRVLEAWGSWREAELSATAADVRYYHAPDRESEIEACALWCARHLQADPKARLLIIAQNLAQQRGEIERAFQRIAGAGEGAVSFEFSLGVSLANVALARGAILMLEWLDGTLAEDEIDWLFSTGLGVIDGAESLALTGFMRALRRRNLQRTRWTLDQFFAQRCGEGLPPGWVARLKQARRRLEESGRRRQAPLEWAGLVPALLEAAGWPGERSLSSAEFQVLHRWQQTLDACASLGFDGRRIPWNEFLLSLKRAAGETLYAPESQDAPIQIAGPAESAGLQGDAIWVLEGDEVHWPATGSTNPLIPFAVQHEAGMPHSSVQLDLEAAQKTIARILASASAVCFSYPWQTDGVERRPARLLRAFAGEPQELPADLIAPVAPQSGTMVVDDLSTVPLQTAMAPGGATVLTSQSQCPFKAFATARLGAQSWEPAQAGLTAAQRGQLLHQVLHSVWAGPADGIRTQDELLALPDLGEFVARHVDRAFRKTLPEGVRECMPRRYLELEEIRLTRLVTEWLEYERERAPFIVADTEQKAEVEIAGLHLKLRLDRIDRLKDESLLVVDYKTGDVTTKSWETPRPDDVQLPLYALFALEQETQPLGGLAFAKVRTGNCCFQGRLWDAKQQLLPSLGATTALVKAPLTLDDLDRWRSCIEDLAREFVAASAEVNPREFPQTCARCGLQAVCRIQEFQPKHGSEEESDV